MNETLIKMAQQRRFAVEDLNRELEEAIASKLESERKIKILVEELKELKERIEGLCQKGRQALEKEEGVPEEAAGEEGGQKTE